MKAATIHEPAAHREELPNSPLSFDPRWMLANRIATSEPFQKSTRLPKLLLYLARHTITGERHKLTEQVIGQAVFGKQQYFDPAEDSSVRVNVRQLRLKLHEFYQTPGLHEELIVSLPKGGYTLDFSPAPAPLTVPDLSLVVERTERSPRRISQNFLFGSVSILLLITTAICAIGWHQAASTQEPSVPWPLNTVIQQNAPTTLVIADAATSLRMLGNQGLTLDDYINHNYLQAILPKHMSDEEAGVFRYLDSTRITSEADVNAAAALSAAAGRLSDNLSIRSARDINVNELTQGNFIFIGSKTSNPWSQLIESRINFQFTEDGPHGARYIVNRHPQAGEQAIYRPSDLGTLASGDDYAVIALLPAQTGSGNLLLMEGVRMEGTSATVALLKSPAGRSKLASKLASANGEQVPKYFEALLHAQSVAGATMAVDIVATRSLQR